MEVTPMPRDVNPLIWEKIENAQMNETIRRFLKELLLFERKHISERRPRYSEEYDKLIEKYSKEMEAKSNEDT